MEKWPRKPSMWAHFQSLRSANSGSVRRGPSRCGSSAGRGVRRRAGVAGGPAGAVAGGARERGPWAEVRRVLAGAAEQGAVEGAGGFGGLGGVLGDVGGDGLLGECRAPSPKAADRADVELCAPARASRAPAVVGRDGDAGARARRRWMASVSRSAVAQAGGGVSVPSGPSRRMTAWKWTSAALLVLGDLGEGDPQVRRGRPSGSGRAGRRSRGAGRW